MPIKIQPRGDRPVRIVIAVGDVTGEDWLASLEQQAADGEWNRATLNDASAVTSVPSAEDVSRLRAVVEELTARYGRRGPVAFVIPEVSALYGIARMYQVATEGTQRVCVCSSRVQAEAWLATVIE